MPLENHMRSTQVRDHISVNVKVCRFSAYEFVAIDTETGEVESRSEKLICRDDAAMYMEFHVKIGAWL